VTWPTAVAQRHIERLAQRAKVGIEWVAGVDQACAAVGNVAPMIWAPKPRSGLTYLVCLHELGHVLEQASAAASMRGDDFMAEAQAWDWAMRHISKHVRPSLTMRHRSLALALLGTHLRWPV
jgi:hypothetical protein